MGAGRWWQAAARDRKDRFSLFAADRGRVLGGGADVPVAVAEPARRCVGGIVPLVLATVAVQAASPWSRAAAAGPEAAAVPPGVSSTIDEGSRGDLDPWLTDTSTTGTTPARRRSSRRRASGVLCILAVGVVVAAAVSMFRGSSDRYVAPPPAPAKMSRMSAPKLQHARRRERRRRRGRRRPEGAGRPPDAAGPEPTTPPASSAQSTRAGVRGRRAGRGGRAADRDLSPGKPKPAIKLKVRSDTPHPEPGQGPQRRPARRRRQARRSSCGHWTRRSPDRAEPGQGPGGVPAAGRRSSSRRPSRGRTRRSGRRANDRHRTGSGSRSTSR